MIDAFDELQREEQKFLDQAEQGLAAMPDWTHGPATIRAKRDHVAEIDRLKDLVHDIKRSERLEEWEYGSRKWIRHAPDVLAAFSAAMSTVGKDYGVSNGGPVSRFFEAVVPLLTGETPTAESVSTQLKKRGLAPNREF